MNVASATMTLRQLPLTLRLIGRNKTTPGDIYIKKIAADLIIFFLNNAGGFLFLRKIIALLSANFTSSA